MLNLSQSVKVRKQNRQNADFKQNEYLCKSLKFKSWLKTDVSTGLFVAMF